MQHAATPPERIRTLGLALVGLLVISTWAFWPSSQAQVTAAGVRVNAQSAYNPVLGGEQLPADFRQILPRDAIQPIYDPTFAPAGQVDWPDSTDVIGVSFGTEAKAYPVAHLNGRELVIDEVDGIPILVSW